MPTSGRDWVTISVSTASVALAGVIGAVSIHQDCHEATPFQPPAAGTARAGYCDAVDPTHPWLTILVLPIVVMLIASLLLGRRKWLVYAYAVALVLALVANAVVVGGMQYEYSF